MEHVGIIMILGIISGFITALANSAFGQTWGALQFFVIWVILLVIVYGGVLVIGDDVF